MPTRPQDTIARHQNLFRTIGKVTPQQRTKRSGHAGRVLWLTGLSGAGKSTIAVELERELFARGYHVYVLDGDNLRTGLCSDLGFSSEDRVENIRRVGEVARLFADAGLVVITAFISPFRTDRAQVRHIVPAGQFVEIFVNAPLEICESRDPKGLYAKARSGQIPFFTGISSPYEVPEHPDIEVRTDLVSVMDAVRTILDQLFGDSAEKQGSPTA